MLDFSKPITTKMGWPVTVLADSINSAYPIIGYVTHPDGKQEGCAWAKVGTARDQEPGYDLINPKVRKKGWVNLYHNGKRYVPSWVYDTEEEAKRYRTGNCVVTIPISWEE